MNPKTLTVLFALGVGLAAADRVVGADSPDEKAIQHGHEVFTHSCAPCHGYGPGDDGRAMLPGPAALTVKYKGARSPYLEERSDLPYPTLKVFVRQGTWSMPGFRKTEITDNDIQDIAAYLADSAKKKKAVGK